MKRVRNVLFCIILAVASSAGIPMRHDEVEELMQAMNQPKVAHTLADENDAGDWPPRMP
jgi:hypothetical protein